MATLPATATEHPPVLERSQPSRRGWTALFVGVLLLQAIGLAAFNLVMDPRAEFPTDLFPPLVSDARELKVREFALLDEKPDTIVLGSSRAMTVSPRVLEEAGYGPTYNFAVDSGKVRDGLRIYETAHALGAPPARLVVLADDWSFRSAHQPRWPNADTLAAGDAVGLTKKLALSLRSDYVEDSWRSLRLQREGFPAREMAFQKDGSVVWEQADQDIARGTYDREGALRRLTSYTAWVYRNASDNPPVGPEPAYLDAFHELMRAAQENGTRVDLVLPPMTAEATARVDVPEAYRTSLAMTRDVLLAACAPSVRVVDLTDPTSYGATDEDFLDGFHPTRAGGERLARAIATQPDLCQQEI